MKLTLRFIFIWKFKVLIISNGKEINLISTKIKFLTKKMIKGLKERKLLSDVKNDRSIHSSIFNISDEDGKLHSFLSKK